MRLILCDSNRILGEALADAMEARGHQVVAITTTMADGLDAVAACQPDAVLLDPHFPGEAELVSADETEGLAAARVMRERFPAVALLVQSSHAAPETWPAARKIGVAGFLRKDKLVSEVADALDVIADGGTVFDPRLCCRAIRSGPGTRQRMRAFYVLTPREKEVLRRIVAGQSTAQMAEEMNITTSTLRTYVKNLLTKLGAHSRLQAAALATRGDLPSELSA